MRPRVATVLAFLGACALAAVSRAQLIIEPPSHLVAPSVSVAPPRSPDKKRPRIAALSAAPIAAPTLAPAEPILSSVLLVSTFSPDFAGGGSERAGTSWVGNVTHNATSITVGGSARDENGWGATGLSLNATGMNFLSITAQRDAGHVASTVFVQFEDLLLRTRVISVPASSFAFGSLTTVTVPLTAWTVDFGPSQITGWSIGGGGVGTDDFRMTFSGLEFSASAIPEPSTYAALFGAAALGLGLIRKRRRNPP